MKRDVPEDRMEHIDEGTIHAWLDGALPAGEGARIEAHVASCAECAAAVAEARGLIAASSRILSALDDVPGGVIPVTVVTGESVVTASTETPTLPAAQGGAQAGTPISLSSGGAATAASARPASRAARRPWYRRPQWAAAAGISFLAVAATAVWQRSGAPGVMESASDQAASAPMVAAAPATDAVQDSASAGASGVAGESAPAAEQGIAPAARRADAAAANDAKSFAASTAAESRKELAAEAKRVVQGDSIPARSPSVTERDVARQAPAVAAPPLPVVAKSAEARPRSAADTAAPRRVGANVADAIARSESARVAGEASAQRKGSGVQVDNVVVTGTSSAARSRTTLQAPAALRPSGSAAVPLSPATLAGCYRVLPSDVANGIGIAALLQLEFAGAGSDEARPAYAAREIGGRTAQAAVAREPLGQPLRWTLGTSGEVVIVRGEGAAAKRVTMRVGVPLDSLAADQLQGTRINCPE